MLKKEDKKKGKKSPPVRLKPLLPVSTIFSCRSPFRYSAGVLHYPRNSRFSNFLPTASFSVCNDKFTFPADTESRRIRSRFFETVSCLSILFFICGPWKLNLPPLHRVPYSFQNAGTSWGFLTDFECLFLISVPRKSVFLPLFAPKKAVIASTSVVLSTSLCARTTGSEFQHFSIETSTTVIELFFRVLLCFGSGVVVTDSWSVLPSNARRDRRNPRSDRTKGTSRGKNMLDHGIWPRYKTSSFSHFCFTRDVVNLTPTFTRASFFPTAWFR